VHGAESTFIYVEYLVRRELKFCDIAFQEYKKSGALSLLEVLALANQVASGWPGDSRGFLSINSQNQTLLSTFSL
jgi:hypothetical protein